MKYRLASLLAVTVAVSQTLVLFLFGQPADSAAISQVPDDPTVSLNLGINDPTLDPALAYDDPSRFAVNQLFTSLVRVDDETGDILPDLASYWQVADSAEVFTFTLRSDVVWSDDTPVTASDVSYSISRVINTDTNSAWAYLFGVIEGVEEYWNDEITWEEFLTSGGITVLDPTHIRFSLREPAAYFLHVLTHPAALTVPESAINAHAASWTEPENIITNGPYTLSSWAHGQSLTLQKNAAHYNALDHEIELVQFSMDNVNDAWASYLNGQLDSAIVPSAQWAAAEDDPNLEAALRKAVRHCTVFYGFNTSIAPFNDVRVRKAFIASLDRQGIGDILLGNVRQAAHSFTPPTVYGYDPDVGIPYDPDQARTWLAEAGYADGGGLPSIDLVFENTLEHQVVSNYAIQSWEDNLGAVVTPVAMPFGAFIDLLNTDPPQVWRLGWCGDFANAHNFLYDFVVPNSGYFGNWDETLYENLLDGAAQTANPAEQRLLFALAEQDLIESDAVLLPVYHYVNGYATKPYLQRTFGNGGFGSYIADWEIGGHTYLPIITQ